MARSRRKTSITGITLAESEKQDKVASHRAYRRTVKPLVNETLETPLPTEREQSNPRDMAKDGKFWRGVDPPGKWRRK